MVDQHWPIEQCKGCRAPVYMARVEAGTRRVRERVVPVDVKRVPARTGTGTVILFDRGAGRAPGARLVANQADLFGVEWAWRKHMDTCPNASWFRSRAVRRAQAGGQ